MSHLTVVFVCTLHSVIRSVWHWLHCTTENIFCIECVHTAVQWHTNDKLHLTQKKTRRISSNKLNCEWEKKKVCSTHRNIWRTCTLKMLNMCPFTKWKRNTRDWEKMQWNSFKNIVRHIRRKENTTKKNRSLMCDTEQSIAQHTAAAAAVSLMHWISSVQ